MRNGGGRDVPLNVLQDYFESLAETGGHPNKRLAKVLTSYAELQFRINGGSHCSVCHAAVRHVVPVRVERSDNTVTSFECLCTRCLEAERALSKRVVLTVGKAMLVYTPGESHPKTQQFRAINF
jgi:hypothetical protein